MGPPFGRHIDLCRQFSAGNSITINIKIATGRADPPTPAPTPEPQLAGAVDFQMQNMSNNNPKCGIFNRPTVCVLRDHQPQWPWFSWIHVRVNLWHQLPASTALAASDSWCLVGFCHGYKQELKVISRVLSWIQHQLKG